jgi:hypothetical protein
MSGKKLQWETPTLRRIDAADAKENGAGTGIDKTWIDATTGHKYSSYGS